MQIDSFEAAADAIVNGDASTLKRLLKENPELVRERSKREHRSTLLHYIAANGVEDWRQKTPGDIVGIAELLLDAGSDVNAESEAYGGASTALNLTATSVHPERAGLQLRLMELLLERGARIDGPNGESDVNACLRNGRGEAAEYLATRGARLDLEGAAGVGRLDLVESFFEQGGGLKFNATPQQLLDGFAWACEFGRRSVVAFLLDRGVPVNARLKHHGQTGLHWASAGGHLDTVKLLLERGASIDAKDEQFEGSPLDWARHAHGEASGSAEKSYRLQAVIEYLARPSPG